MQTSTSNHPTLNQGSAKDSLYKFADELWTSSLRFENEKRAELQVQSTIAKAAARTTNKSAQMSSEQGGVIAEMVSHAAARIIARVGNMNPGPDVETSTEAGGRIGAIVNTFR
jgi:hypothetical protein